MKGTTNRKERTFLTGFVCFVCFVALFIRLFFIQVVDSSTLEAKANEQWIYHHVLKAKRGTIYDRSHNEMLAWEADAYIYVAEPKFVKNPRQTAELLSPILSIPVEDIYSRLIDTRPHVEIRGKGKYKFSVEVNKKVTALIKSGAINGIAPLPAQMRGYMPGFAPQMLGFLNVDEKAVGGVEQQYDRFLKGRDGEIQYLQAKGGMMLSDQPQKHTPPLDGNDLVLTIDARIQQQAEKQLDEAVRISNAKGGVAIVADPRTGEILAMASRPTFDPNDYSNTYTPEGARNMATESQFEPGSTFKIVTLAAALEEGLFHADEKFSSGALEVGGRIIHDWKREGWGNITYRKGVELSSNVAFIKLGQALGSDKLSQYITKFGFGDITKRSGYPTGIDLPNEAKGYYYNNALGPVELATTAFGQGVAVTPIQQVMAVSAIANGGRLVQPHVLKEIWSPDQKRRIRTFQPVARQIIKVQTARQEAEILRGVVTSGTGKEADLPGYKVAGKTGTGQVPDPEHGGYIPGRYVVSFIGFAPYDNPDVLVYVAIDQPSSGSGSSLASPLAREILRYSLQMRNVLPDVIGK